MYSDADNRNFITDRIIHNRERLNNEDRNTRLERFEKTDRDNIIFVNIVGYTENTKYNSSNGKHILFYYIYLIPIRWVHSEVKRTDYIPT